MESSRRTKRGFELEPTGRSPMADYYNAATLLGFIDWTHVGPYGIFCKFQFQCMPRPMELDLFSYPIRPS
jgi:hypothetical protein